MLLKGKVALIIRFGSNIPIKAVQQVLFNWKRYVCAQKCSFPAQQLWMALIIGLLTVFPPHLRTAVNFLQLQRLLWTSHNVEENQATKNCLLSVLSENNGHGNTQTIKHSLARCQLKCFQYTTTSLHLVPRCGRCCPARVLKWLCYRMSLGSGAVFKEHWLSIYSTPISRTSILVKRLTSTEGIDTRL